MFIIRPVGPDQAIDNYRRNIQRLRVEHAWSYDELARKSRISHQLIRNIEKGESVGSLRTFLKLASVLGVGLDEITSTTPKE